MDGELAIEIANATVRYSAERNALTDFSWRVRRGEHWFILGSNGAGKTTLVKMLMGLKWPLFGATVRVLGERFGHTNLVELRKRIAWLSPFLVKWTSPSTRCDEIILSGIDGTMGLTREAAADERERCLELMTEFDCAKLAAKPFEELSSGEQLKILICRALIVKPELLILDEACVHLDMKSREHLLETIERVAEQPGSPTMVFITQRIEDVTGVFTKGLIIRDGRILACGERDEVLTEENLSRTFDMPLKLHRVFGGRLWAVPAVR